MRRTTTAGDTPVPRAPMHTRNTTRLEHQHTTARIHWTDLLAARLITDLRASATGLVASAVGQLANHAYQVKRALKSLRK